MISRPEIVLVAEDQSLVRMMALDMLSDRGFAAVGVADAGGALARLEPNASGIRVLFTDIEMPGPMDGLELARLVRRRWPRIGLLIASGRVRPAKEEMPEGTHFLPKVYDADQLAAHVRALFGVTH